MSHYNRAHMFFCCVKEELFFLTKRKLIGFDERKIFGPCHDVPIYNAHIVVQGLAAQR